MKKVSLLFFLLFSFILTPEISAQNSVQDREYEYIIDDWDKSEYENFINRYPKNKNIPELKSRIEEIDLWEAAKKTNTPDSYRNYLKKTKYAHYRDRAMEGIQKAEQRLVEREWDNVRNMNSIQEYRNFINEHPGTPQAAEAQRMIDNLNALDEWKQIRNTEDVAVLEAFIAKYPQFPQINEASSRIHGIKAKELFESGRKDEAMDEFVQITVMDALPQSVRNLENQLIEYNDFKQLSVNSPMSDLERFTRDYPLSEYAPEVYNYIALNKAQGFNPYSTKQDYQEALSMASGPTYKKIQSLIDKNEKDKSFIAAQERKARRKANGGWCGLVIEYGDFAWNGRTGETGLFTYEFGLKLRIGNYADRVQFAVGVKPGVGVWDFNGELNGDDDDYYSDNSGKSSAFFTMPVEAELKINLAKTGATSWFYLDGRFDYNAVREKKAQRPMAVNAGLGFGGKTWDILFYYGLGLGDVENLRGLDWNPLNDTKYANYFGISFSATIPL